MLDLSTIWEKLAISFASLDFAVATPRVKCVEGIGVERFPSVKSSITFWRACEDRVIVFDMKCGSLANWRRRRDTMRSEIDALDAN